MNIFGNDIDPGDNFADMDDQDADVCRVCRMEETVLLSEFMVYNFVVYVSFLIFIYRNFTKMKFLSFQFIFRSIRSFFGVLKL